MSHIKDLLLLKDLLECKKTQKTTTTTKKQKKDSQADDNCVKNIYFDVLHDIVDRCNISEQ